MGITDVRRKCGSCSGTGKQSLADGQDSGECDSCEGTGKQVSLYLDDDLIDLLNDIQDKINDIKEKVDEL